MRKGKRYKREGFCSQCGDCCIPEDCEHLTYDKTNKAWCKIFGKPERPNKCKWFPQAPPIIFPRCTFYFLDTWENNRKVKYGRDL